MSRRALKLALFLLLGAVINLLVAWSLDFHANTLPQRVSLMLPEDAKDRGWISQVPDDAMAAWGFQSVGISMVSLVAGEAEKPFDVDLENNKIVFPMSGLMEPVMRESNLVAEARTGWPIPAFAGRAETERSPRLGSLTSTTRGRIQIEIAMRGGFSDGQRIGVFSEEPLTLDFGARKPLNTMSLHVVDERIDRSSLEASGIEVRTESSEERSTIDPPDRSVPRSTTRPPRNADAGAATGRSEPANLESLHFTGTISAGFSRIQPLPAASAGRWNTETLIQNFDPNHRVWPLAYRPLWPGFAINTVFYALILWLLLVTPRAIRSTYRTHRGLCPQCAYDLRGGPHEKCPECGTRA